MELKTLPEKFSLLLHKYRYVVIVLMIGVILMTFPTNNKTKLSNNIQENTINNEKKSEMEALVEILSNVHGAGEVKVLLSVSKGEETVYQTDHNSSSGENGSTQIKTVLVNDSQHNQTGLIRQILPPTYLGAVIVCQGADSPTVKLAITTAVSKITGLGADNICVLKMK